MSVIRVGFTSHQLIEGDCLGLLRSLPDDSVDCVLTSPPYESSRSYGVGFNLNGQDWVDWAVARYVECNRVCRGLVVWVVEGRTRNFRWSATPFLMGADLHRRGIKLRKPPAFVRVGISGSGGNDYLRNDFELMLASSKGKLPWSDNTAMGGPPKYKPGGDHSHQTREGRVKKRKYVPPERVNPGNVIRCKVGGGHMGSDLAHENEAPFPESLAEFVIRSFCPPGGTILDPFCGSGTTSAVAAKFGRNSIGIDLRGLQVELSHRRLAEIGVVS